MYWRLWNWRSETIGSVEVSSEYVFIDGVMDHEALAGLENEEDERWAARLAAEYRVSERWGLSLGYMELRDLNVSDSAGCSPPPPPWLEPGKACHKVLTPIRLELGLQQFVFGLDYVIWSNDRNRFSIGVSGVLSVASNSRFEFVDRAPAGFPTYQDILNERHVHDETQWDLGTRMSYQYDIGDHWSLTTWYRLTQRLGRTLHHVGLGIRVRS